MEYKGYGLSKQPTLETPPTSQAHRKMGLLSLKGREAKMRTPGRDKDHASTPRPERCGLCTESRG